MYQWGPGPAWKWHIAQLKKGNLCWKKNGDEAAVNSEPRGANVSVEFRNERVVLSTSPLTLSSGWDPHAELSDPPTQPFTAAWSYEMYAKIKSQISKGKNHSGGMYHKPNILKEVCCPACSLLCLLAGKFTDRHVHVTDCLLGTSPLKNPRSYLLSTRCPVTLKFGLPILVWHVWLHMVK